MKVKIKRKTQMVMCPYCDKLTKHEIVVRAGWTYYICTRCGAEHE